MAAESSLHCCWPDYMMVHLDDDVDYGAFTLASLLLAWTPSAPLPDELNA
jgi:hypothetical protein